MTSRRSDGDVDSEREREEAVTRLAWQGAVPRDRVFSEWEDLLSPHASATPSSSAEWEGALLVAMAGPAFGRRGQASFVCLRGRRLGWLPLVGSSSFVAPPELSG